MSWGLETKKESLSVAFRCGAMRVAALPHRRRLRSLVNIRSLAIAIRRDAMPHSPSSDRMMTEDPARARAEWFAEFRDDLVAFVDPAVVDRAVVPGRIELPPVPGVTYVAATDPSGGSSDSMTLALAHAEDKGQRAVLDRVAEWRAPFSPRQVVMEAAAICKRYSVRTVIGDRYGGLRPRAVHASGRGL